MALENDKPTGLVLFSQINKQGSLSAAAQTLGMSRSSVSKQLAALEKRVGARLFNRTTRKIVLTDVGQQVLKEAHKIESALHAIEHISEGHQSQVSGTINLSCSSAQGRVHLVPLITQFLARHPNLAVNLQLEDRFVDMVAEGIDVSIRIGYLPDSSLIARKLGDLSWVLCASPEYLKGAPPLNSPQDLLDHRCIYYKNAKRAMNTWSFSKDDHVDTVTVNGPLSMNDASALVSAAVAHAGVLLIDKSMLGNTLERGALIPLLEHYQPIGGLPMYVVYSEKEFMPAKTRLLINYLLEEMPALL